VNRIRFSLVALLVLLGGPQIIYAQQPASLEQIPLAPPALIGVIENAAGQFRLNLTNTDAAREFRGTAHISLGNAAQQTEAGQLAVALAPQEARVFPLAGLKATGDQYLLTIYDQAGVVILYKLAPVRRVQGFAGPPSAPTVTPTPSPSPPPVSENEVQVEPRLAGGENENDPFVLAFELAAPRPIINATFSISAKGLQQRKPVNVQGRITVDFKLPEDLEDHKIKYALTDATGRVLAQGETDLEQLMADDYVSISEVKLDRPAYAPGESAHIVVQLQGTSRRGYRLESSVKDGRGTIFSRDTRKGVSEGKAAQEFSVFIPRETPGPVIFEFKVYDAETGTLLDSGEREIPLTSAGAAPRPGT
jgi:hypothetical protein